MRLLVWPWIFHDDIKVSYWWGKFAADFGLRGYYDWLNFGGYTGPEQPVLYIDYTLVVRRIYEITYRIMWWVNVNVPIFPSRLMTWYFEKGNQMLLKLPFILGDLGLIAGLAGFAAKEFGKKAGKRVAWILALFPPLWYNSAIWGSGDSVINLLGLTAVYLFFKRRYGWGVVAILGSILFKSSLLIWLPVVFLVFLKSKPKMKEVAIMIVLGVALIWLLARPFTPLGVNPVWWMGKIMITKILPGCMWQLTSNAFNVWAVMYGLVPRLDEMKIWVLSARNWSILICLTGYAAVVWHLVRNYSKKTILLALVNVTMITFTFMTRMHERYTFPALMPLLLLSYYDKKYWKYFVILSMTHMLNVYHWWWVPEIGGLRWLLSRNLTERGIALINVILTLGLLVEQNRIRNEAGRS